MNPQQTQSAGTSALLYALGVGLGVLVTKGIMTQDQANALLPGLASVILVVGGIAVGEWKRRQHSPAAVAAAVVSTPAVASAVVKTMNSDAMPDIKIVASSSTAPQVTVDSKGNVRPDPVASKS